MVQNNKEFYSDLCRDVFKEFSSHSIMKYSIEYVYLYYNNNQIDFTIDEINEIKIFVEKLSPIEANINFRFLKFIHFGLYMLVLYLAVVYIPNILISIFVYFIDKLQYIFFVILIIEGILNIYIDLNLNMLGWLTKLSSYLPINFFTGLFFNLLKELLGE
jgi:hypothetical protein